jgi:hypothetical protein
LRAKIVSCLRIAVGFDIKTQALIEAEVQIGDVVLGKVQKSNPLPPTEYHWHIHHEKLFEAQTEPIENRIAYIKENKPKAEVETRLRLLHKVTNVKALKYALVTNNHEALEKLHKEECPNCPWNGKTIFPKEAA